MANSLENANFGSLEAEAEEADNDAWDLDGDEVQVDAPAQQKPSSPKKPVAHWNDPPANHFQGATRAKIPTTKPRAARSAQPAVEAPEEDSWGLFDDAAIKEEASWGSEQPAWTAPAAVKKTSVSKIDQMREERKAVRPTSSALNLC